MLSFSTNAFARWKKVKDLWRRMSNGDSTERSFVTVQRMNAKDSAERESRNCETIYILGKRTRYFSLCPLRCYLLVLIRALLGTVASRQPISRLTASMTPCTSHMISICLWASMCVDCIFEQIKNLWFVIQPLTKRVGRIWPLDI